MRWVLFALLSTGCTQVFGIKSIDGPEVPVCFDEPFDAPLDPARYNVADPPLGGTTAVAGGTLTFTWSAVGGNNYGHVETVTPLNLVGGYASVDVDDIVGTAATADLYVFLDDSHVYDISADTSAIDFDLYDGDSTHFTKLATMPYFTKPLTFRIEHDVEKNQVVFTASTAKDTMSFPVTTPFTLQSVNIGLEAGTYDIPDGPGHAELDNLTVASNACL